jgi:hypothetical protein
MTIKYPINLRWLNYRNPGQVFSKKGIKEVIYEKYKTISILYPIDYQ